MTAATTSGRTRRARISTFRGRILAGVGAMIAFVLIGGGVALAFWLFTDSSNPALAAADTLPAGATPTAVVTPAANSNTVGVTFATTAKTLSNRSITTYVVRRYSASTNTLANTFTCTPPTGSFSCTEASVLDGSWTYTDAAALGANWQGVESAKSTTVIVDTTAPTVAVTFPAASGSYGSLAWNAGCSSSICGTATDAGSGVKSIAVSVQQTATSKYWTGIGSAFTSATEVKVAAVYSSGTWTLAFPATDFPADGAYVVKGYGTDNDNNISTGTSVSFTVDTTPPTVPAPVATAAVTFGTNPTFVNSETVNLTDAATDTGSGVQSVTYFYCVGASGSCTSANWTSIGSSLTSAGNFPVSWVPPLPADGPYRIVAVGVDNAGNVSGSSAATLVTIDTTPPTVSRPIVNGNA